MQKVIEDKNRKIQVNSFVADVAILRSCSCVLHSKSELLEMLRITYLLVESCFRINF